MFRVFTLLGLGLLNYPVRFFHYYLIRFVVDKGVCHIREKVTDKVYHEVGRVKKLFRGKKKPKVLIAASVAQAEGEVILKKEKYIDAVIGPQSYHQINSLISNYRKDRIELTEFETKDKFDYLDKINKAAGVSKEIRLLGLIRSYYPSSPGTRSGGGDLTLPPWVFANSI